MIDEIAQGLSDQITPILISEGSSGSYFMLDIKKNVLIL